jgi:hypothetical protein
MCVLAAQAQVEYLVSKYKMKPFADNLPMGTPPIKAKKEGNLRDDLSVHTVMDHVVRAAYLRETYGMGCMQTRIEMFCHPVFVTAFAHFVSNTEGMKVGGTKRDLTAQGKMIRKVSWFQKHCKHVVDNMIARLPTPGQELQQLSDRLEQVIAGTLNMANVAKTEGMHLRAAGKNEADAQLRARASTTAEVQQMKEQALPNVLRFHPQQEVRRAQALLDGWYEIAQLMPDISCAKPAAPLSKQGREWAWATNVVLATCVVVGAFVPPTREEVWAETTIIFLDQYATCMRKTCSAECPGNNAKVPRPDDTTSSAVFALNHHKAGEKDVERKFFVTISDKKLVLVLKAWKAWARWVDATLQAVCMTMMESEIGLSPVAAPHSSMTWAGLGHLLKPHAGTWWCGDLGRVAGMGQ